MTSIFLSGNGLNILVYARNSVINSQAGRGCSCVREQSLDAKMGPIEFSDLDRDLSLTIGGGLVVQVAKFYGPHFCVKTPYTLSMNRPFLLPYFCHKKEYWTCSCLRMLSSFTLTNLRYINRVFRIHM